MDFREQLRPRKKDKISSKFVATENFEMVLATSSTDEGVIRNGGRRGAAHGPMAIMNQFKNLVAPNSQLTYRHFEMGNRAEETQDFPQSQKHQVDRFKNLLKQKERPILHLGGGHDHAYPFVRSLLEQSEKKLHLINLDAHLDTRQDTQPHSGTPFRQLADEFPQRFTISQFGIHPYANTEKNYLDMPCDMNVFTKAESTWENFTKVFKENKDDYFVLSLDADGVDAMTMEAVSAVNHDGLSAELVSVMFDYYFKTIPRKQWAVGIYEYNPLFDNLSSKGARYLASLLYKVYDA